MGKLLEKISSKNNTRALKALIVDDLKINRSLARVMLERNNFEIFEAENGKEALDYFEGQQLDFVLMDICMPVMNGIEAMEEIKKLTQTDGDVPIIAFTSGEHTNSKSDLLEKGFSEYLKKPFNEQDLFDKISKILPTLTFTVEQRVSKKAAI
jgi:CheY-like chemotaxis protein